jgi:hypothetical protein
MSELAQYKTALDIAYEALKIEERKVANWKLLCLGALFLGAMAGFFLR